MGFDKVNQKIPGDNLQPIKHSEEIKSLPYDNKIGSLIRRFQEQNLNRPVRDYHYNFHALEVVTYPGDILSLISNHSRIKLLNKNGMEQIISKRMKTSLERKPGSNVLSEEILRNLHEIFREAARERAIGNIEGEPLGEEEIEALVKEITISFIAYLEKHGEEEKKKSVDKEYKDEKIEKEIIPRRVQGKSKETNSLECFPLSEEKVAMFKILYLRLVENRRKEGRKEEEVREKEILHRHIVSQEIKKDEIRKDEIKKL